MSTQMQYEHGVEPQPVNGGAAHDWLGGFEYVPNVKELVDQARAHMKAERWAEAEMLLQRACDTDKNGERMVALAICQHKQRRLKDAWETAFAASTTAEAWLLIAAIYEEWDKWEEAERQVYLGLEKFPDHHGLLFARGLQRLRKGNSEGWTDYEHRIPRLNLLKKIDDIPEWDGTPGSGILAILGQQGLGDQIMFSRWIPEACARWGGSIVLYTQPSLVRLFTDVFRSCTVVGSDPECPDNVDAWISIDSLPYVLSLSYVPKSYYPPLVQFKDFPALDSVAFKGNAFRVGLCWAGNPQHDRDWLRSMSWEDFRAMLPDDPRIEYHSLQLGAAVPPEIVDNTHLLFDMSDTAAYIEKLDMVVTVDTSIVHLAGAMGKPCLLIVGPGSDWRWKNRDWYDSVTDIIERDEKHCVERISSGIENRILYEIKVPSAKIAHISSMSIQTIRTVETLRGPFQIFCSDRWVSRSLAIYGEYSRGEGDLLAEFVKPGDTVIEAGVNIGWHMRHLTELVGPDGHVIGFEPNPATLELAVHNVFGDSRCRCDAVIYAAALSNESAAQAEFVHDALAPVNARLKKAQKCGPGEIISVPTTRLDEYRGDRLDFLMADIESHELEMLQGAEATIMRCRPYLYVENDSNASIETRKAMALWIHAHDYRMYQHFPPLYPGRDCGKPNVFGSIISGMLFCVPREKYPKIPQRLGLNRIIAEQERVS